MNPVRSRDRLVVYVKLFILSIKYLFYKNQIMQTGVNRDLLLTG